MITPSRIDELERLETLARAAQTSHKDNDDWYTWRSQMDRYHVAASPDVILALLAELKRMRGALERIAGEKEVHTRLNQQRLCCMFQQIASEALAAHKGGERG